MGSNAAKQQVAEYRMSVHFGIALKVDALLGVYVNDKPAWTGRSTTLEALNVNQPDLFGGKQKEGGLVGTIHHLPGDADQVFPEELAGRLGKTSATSPAYRGLTSIFFSGHGFAGTEFHGLEGLGATHSSSEGFLWTMNNPVVAQTVAAKVERASRRDLDPATAMIGPDANPAHMIFDCLSNPDWGMGASDAAFDLTSFRAAATALFAEQFGLSMIWTRQTTIEAFVVEILDHIQGTLFLSPATGLWTLKLLRDDYDVGTLRTVSPDNANLGNFQRALWGETANEITVTWTNPGNEDEETVTAQDDGSILSQGGAPIAGSRNYYGIRNKNLAMQVAQRDVRASAAPLASASAMLDRSAWSVVPGDVLLLNWPEKEVYNIVVRVMSVDYGKPGASQIKVTLLQDVFSLEKPLAVVPDGSGWVDPAIPPEPLAASEIITLPAYFVASGDLQSSAQSLTYPEVLTAVFGYQDDTSALSFALYSEDIVSTGDARYVSHGNKSLTERTVLAATMPAAPAGRISADLILRPTRGPRVGGFVWLGALNDETMEIAQVTSLDVATQEWVLARGVLDTVPRAWSAGTPVWFVNPGSRVVDETTLHSAGEVVTYKLRTRTSLGMLPLAGAPEINQLLNARPHLPLRPANVKVNGTAFGSVGVSTDLVVTWSTRNRLFEDGLVLAWDGGSVPPEYKQGTVIKVFDQSGNLVFTQPGIWTATTWTLPATWFARYSSIRIEVSAQREGLDSLQAHSIVVTGLPANGGAALPPAAVDTGVPPAPAAAPAEGAWSATGSQFALQEDGVTLAAMPAILVSGVRDRPDAAGLIVRYKRTAGAVDWFYLPEVILDDQPTQSATTAVVAVTQYDVEVSYRMASNLPSEWRSLGSVTTGAIVAQSLEDMTAAYIRSTIAAAVADIIAIDAAGVALQGEVAALETALLATQGDLTEQGVTLAAESTRIATDVLTNSRSILEMVMRSIETRQYLDPLIWDGQTPVKTVLHDEITNRIDGDTAIVEIVDLIGAVSGDALAFILNTSTIQIGGGESLATRLSSISATLGANTSAISSEATTRATADSAFATLVSLLGAQNGGATAFVLNTSTVQIGGGESLATRFSTITSSVGANTSAITSEATARSNADSAFATLISLLGAQNGGGTAFVLDTSTTQIGGGETLATRLSSISSSLGTNSSAITSEATARSNADSAVATLISLLGAQNGGGTAFVINTATAQIGGGETLATRLSSISSSLGTNSSAITSEATTRSNADSAMASDLSLLGAHNVGSTAFVLNTATAQIGGGESLATRLSSISASLGANSSAITSEATTRTTADSALSTLITSLTSTVGGHTTSITSLASADALLGGKWGVAINAYGYISGIILNNGGSSSSFVVQVDTFAVIPPTGGTPIVPFTISGGVTYLENAWAKKLVTGSAGRRAAATSFPSSYFDDYTEATVVTLTYTAQGGDLKVDTFCTVGVSTTTGIIIRLYRDGSIIGEFGDRFIGPYTYSRANWFGIINETAGSHTYELRVLSAGGVGNTGTAHVGSLFVTESYA